MVIRGIRQFDGNLKSVFEQQSGIEEGEIVVADCDDDGQQTRASSKMDV